MNMHAGAPPPTPAATVVVVRDGAGSLEVLMLCRQVGLAVHGGAYVFPGGKVESGDALLEEALCHERPRALRDALGEPELSEDEAVALYVAAVRETYEDAGILLAESASCEGACAVAVERAEPFADIVRRYDLRLSTLVPWSRWITPAASFTSSRRFDTRFFVCAAPEGQLARHDVGESSEAVWLTPQEALRRFACGEIKLLPPQFMTLTHIATFMDVASVIAAAHGRRPYVVRPVPLGEGDHRMVVYPGDELHPQRERVMPGPTRLFFVDGRYAPAVPRPG
ncbi:NUDIX domain-containing protein [Ramlibacter sp. AN1015]|uniref:NUDIX hydrolase n=1 Tax=Ramlibacter sp. AN1015 TaxID=3133428 RepID=UPI0030C62B77